MIRTIDKVKYDQKIGTVEIEYTLSSMNDEIKTVLKSEDKPRREFLLCLQSLTSDVEKICSLPEGYCIQATIKGVSFSHKHDIMGATITALIKVETADSPVVINTPFLPESQYNEGGTAPILPRLSALKLKELIALATAYIDGDREPSSQTKLDI